MLFIDDLMMVGLGRGSQNRTYEAREYSVYSEIDIKYLLFISLLQCDLYLNYITKAI